MSLLRASERREASLPSWLEAVNSRRAGSAGTGPGNALRLSAVWACQNFVADLISTMPVDTYRVVGGQRVQIDNPAVISNPSAFIDDITWRRQVIMSWLTAGNLFALPTAYTQTMWPQTVEVADPGTVRGVRNGGTGSITWKINGVPYSDVLHVASYTLPGQIVGLSPLEHAAQVIGLGLSAQEFGLRWFEDGGHPSAILSNEETTIDADQAKTVKERFLAALSGGREPAVLGRGWKYQSVQVAPNESQFLETIQANIADIARFYGLKPEDIGGKSQDSQTYANVEQRALDRLTYPIGTWVVKLERFMSSLLPKPQFVKINTDALVRVDLRTRYDVHALAIRSGMASVNERRRIEDEPPIPDGNTYLWPPMTTTAPKEGTDG